MTRNPATRNPSPTRHKSAWIVLFGLFVLGVTSCKSTDSTPQPDESRLDSGWRRPNRPWREAHYAPIKATIPTVADAELVDDDEFCMMCHQTYVEAFANNVHRQGKCESCHGPASRHLETCGKEPGMILGFKTMSPIERSEACAKCHEQDACAPGTNWRTSVHAHSDVACTDCHRNHYNVPPGTPPTTLPGEDARHREENSNELVGYQEPSDQLASLRGTSNNLGEEAPGTCYQCHGDKQEL